MYLTDSTCALAQISSDSVLLNIFNSHRCSEIQQLSQPEEWRWLPTDQNIADLATRGDCSVQDVSPGCVYQTGFSWLRLEHDQWPVKTAAEINPKIPESELNQKMVKLRCMVVQSVDEDFWRCLGWRTYTKARCTMMAVIKAANCFKAKLAKKRGAAKSGDSGGDNHGLKFYEDHDFSISYLAKVVYIYMKYQLEDY